MNSKKRDLLILESFRNDLEQFRAAFFGWPFSAVQLSAVRSRLEIQLPSVELLISERCDSLDALQHGRQALFSRLAELVRALLNLEHGDHPNYVINSATRTAQAIIDRAAGEIEGRQRNAA